MMEFYLREVYPWLIKASTYSFLIPLVAGFILLPKRKSRLFRLLLFYAGFIGLGEVVSQLTVFLGTNNNLWLGHLFTPLDFLLLATIYYFSFEKRLIRRSIQVMVAVVVGFSASSVLWGEAITQMNSQPRMLAGLLLLCMAVLYLYQLISKPNYVFVDRDPIFVLSAGVIVFQAGTAMAYNLFNEALAESYDAARMCLSVILVLNILFRVVLMMAIRRAPVV
ncbi:hypothetical protein [Pontibacter mangrovi]|uniref:Uncharacterized protein n=1 Tax=Pontibacter mangrovi TaxID=2589816 RepID=A0A501WB17_9BACT|nr:hypothetical protein [Pontibacter mangrovi]TPE44391.1 hypothetical protein FJM65_09585 [Pontibacter mangrovi]